MALVDIDGDPWPQEYEGCDKLCYEIAETLTLRDIEEKTSVKYGSLSSSVYVRLKQLSSEVASLKSRLIAASSRCVITLEEAERRSRLVEQIESRAVQLQKRYEKGYLPNNGDRLQLLQREGAGSSLQGIRGWNGSEEVDVDQIRKKQKAMIEEQNEGLESLAKIISRQKEIARTIGSEAELHNEIIDDLTDGIDRTTTRLMNETRQVRVISRKDSTCGYWIVILILFVAILLVALV